MKVGMYYNNKDIRVEEIELPKISYDELLIRVIACGICRSDVLEWYRMPTAPKVLGHEVVGVIAEVGKNVKKYIVGERVFVTHHVPCGECKYCRRGLHTLCDTLRKTNFYPGGFSEYLRLPKINVEKGIYLLPPEISFEEGTFIEPLGCVIRGQRLAKIEKEDTVLILGSGISGLLHIQLAKIIGAKEIISTDINDYRLEMAKKFGADITLKHNEICKTKILADKVIVSTDAISAIEQSFNFVDRGGTILFFAPLPPGVKISLPFFKFWHNQIKLISTYAAVKEDIEEAIELIKNKKINVKDMITHIFPLTQIRKAFEVFLSEENVIKVIIKP